MERMGFVKKLLSALVVIAVVIGLGVVGCGSPTTSGGGTTTSTKPATTDTKPAETKSFEGKFESMDQDKGTFVIKVDDKDKEFKDVKDLIKDFKKDDYKKGETKVKVTTDKDEKKVTKIE